MAIASTMGLTIGFDLTNEKFNFTDVNPYVAEGIALADVEGIITVTAPDGTVWHQGVYTAPDIAPNVSLSNNVIDIPTDANGDPQTGVYTIVYEITVAGVVQPGTYSKSYTPELCASTPTLAVTATVDALCGIITAQDTTAYTTTDGTWVVNSRTLTLYNANPLASPSSYSTSSASLTVSNNIYIGTWRYSLVVNVTLTTSTGSCTIDLETIGTLDVQSGDLCSIYCCVNTLNNNYNSAVTAGDTKSVATYGSLLNRVAQIYTIIQQAVACGKNANASTQIAYLKQILNCTDDCNCDGDEPQLLVPICGAGAGGSYTFVAGTGLTVTNVAGTITYALSANNAALLAAVYNTTVVSSGGTITVTPTVTAGNPDEHEFDIDISTTVQNSLANETDFVVFLTMNPGGAPTVSVTPSSVYGTTLQTPTAAVYNYGDQDSFAVIELSSFYVAGATPNFKAMIQMEELTFPASWPVANFGSQFLTVEDLWKVGYFNTQALDVEILDIASGTMNFRFNTSRVLSTSTLGQYPYMASGLTWRMINDNFATIKIFGRIVI